MAYTVLHSLAKMNRGGAETLIMNIYRHIDRTKFNFKFLLNANECDYADEIIRLGGEIYTIPARSSGVRNYCESLDKFFAAHKGEFDAVHLHTSSLSSLEILYFAKKHGINKRIIHSHNTVQVGILHNILHWLNKPILRFLATDYLACSQVASKWLYEFTGVLNKSVVINNGIDIKQFEYNDAYRNEIRTKYGIPLNDIVIGHVGRFDDVKNHSFLIDIYESIHNSVPNSKLVCVGTGNRLEEITKTVSKKNLSESVILTGVQPEVYKYLSAFDYFVFPSLYEGLPVALVEAQAAGLMTIASDKVSSEANLSKYFSQYSLNNSASEWASFILSQNILDRKQWVYQLEDAGYNITKTVNYLTENIYI